MSQVYQARLLINGDWISKGDTFDVLHPQTRSKAATAISASSKDCLAAVEAAANAQEAWEATAPSVRRQIFLRAADLLHTNNYKTRIAEANCKETGATDNWGRFNSEAPSILLRDAASLASTIRGETLQSETDGVTFVVQRKACGVILAIGTWNAPGFLTTRSIAIPLICGNTVVFKSSEVCPYTSSIIVEALQEAGLPKGVINYLNMSRESAADLTAEIIGHPLVRKINFTGSDRVGRLIAMEAGKHLKPCVFECGGKAPCVVLEDADLQAAARSIVSGSMMNSGQICISTERVIVQRSISSSLIDSVKSLLTKLHAASAIGPVFSESHAKSIVNLIQDAKNHDVQVLVGEGKNDGAKIGPHMLVGVKPGMDAWSKESFGPVIGFALADSVDEAIKLANDTAYSLTASLWTRSIDGIRLASKIRAGTVIVNGNTFNTEISFDNFGLGGATGYGRFDVEHFTDLRAISIRPPNEKYPFVDMLDQANGQA